MPFSLEGGDEVELTEEQIDQLLETDAFRQIDASGFRRSLPLRDILRNDVRILDYQPGDLVVRHGDWGSSAFYVLSGSVRVELGHGDNSSDNLIRGFASPRKKSLLQSLAQLWRNSRTAEVRTVHGEHESVRTRSVGRTTRVYIEDVAAVIEKNRTVRLEPGHWFGEIAALGRTQRVASVFAEDTVQLAEIRWQGLRDLMRFDRNGALKQFIEDMFRERALASFLRTENLFADISEGQMDALIPHCRLEAFGEYDTATPFRDVARQSENDASDEVIVAEEGAAADAVYLIRSGVARLSQKHHHGRRTVGYLNPGRAFGLTEILSSFKSGSPQKYSCRLSAIGYLNAVAIPADTIHDLLQSGAIALPHDAEELKAAAPVREELLNFLVDGKYVQGTATMVIDLNRCTRCDDCVQACAVAHDNNPRFIRHGPVSGRHMIANACMHCADPVCMIECPTGAIHRDIGDGLVLINEQTCIGCAKCAGNCPFDAIRMVETRDNGGGLIVDTKGTPILQATKCDLCQEQPTGPACQRACPHDALERVNLQDPFDLKGVITR